MAGEIALGVFIGMLMHDLVGPLFALLLVAISPASPPAPPKGEPDA